MSITITDITERPNVGSGGRPIPLRTNFFRVALLPVDNIHHYNVDIEPCTAQARKYKIWEAFLNNDDGREFGSKRPIFDGRRNIFSIEPFLLGDQQAKQFSVDLSGNPEFGSSPKNVFQIRIKLVNVIEMSDLQRFLNGHAPCTTNCLTAIMVLDILIRYLPSLSLYNFGRSIFTDNDKRPLSNGVEVWQGFYQSARPALGRMLINIDISNTTVYESGPLPEIVAKILNKSSIDELRCGIPDRDIAKLKKLLTGRRIQVVHRGERNHVFQILNISKPANQLTFTDHKDHEATVSDYFVTKYNKRLIYPFLPCIVVKHGNFLPMEVCQIVGGQRYTKNLNPKQTAEFIKVTCQPPQVRANKINQGLSLLKHRENPYFEKFGMKINQEMEIINARILNAPTVNFAIESESFVPQGGAWNLRAKKLAKPTTISSWSVLNFAGDIPIPAIQKFLRDLIQSFHQLGLNMKNRTPPIISADPQGNIEQHLKDAFLKAGNTAKSHPQILFCILPNSGKALYAEIKRISDTILALPTQCLQSKFIAGNNKQYNANVCLKVNMKLGGVNSHLKPNDLPFISQRPTIVFGADVNHPAPGSLNSPSIAALTASLDEQVVQFASTIRHQEGRVEIIVNLAEMIIELLRTFYKKTGVKPERILFFRDGISEGQFKQVLNSEVAAIRAACEALDANYRPSLTFVVVQKRHYARFFPIRKEDSDGKGNCGAGTVVDQDVVHPFEFDYFLQSHTAIKGTARPAHYYVLNDDNKFTADALQQLTYNLCYVYGRATRSVSIVPAAYYADLVAARARLHRKGGDWSDSTSSTTDLDSQKATFGSVPFELSETPYIM